MAPLAARLLTAEIVIFELLVWIPNLSAGPSNHFNWAGNAICIALVGASWVVSDSISHCLTLIDPDDERKQIGALPLQDGFNGQ
jgi:hypothetical protein